MNDRREERLRDSAGNSGGAGLVWSHWLPSAGAQLIPAQGKRNSLTHITGKAGDAAGLETSETPGGPTLPIPPHLWILVL